MLLTPQDTAITLQKGLWSIIFVCVCVCALSDWLTGAHVLRFVHVAAVIAVAAAAQRSCLDGGATVEWTLLTESRPLERLEGALRASCKRRRERVEVVNILRKKKPRKVASGHELNMDKQSERVPGLHNSCAVVEELLPLTAWSQRCAHGDSRQIMRLRSKRPENCTNYPYAALRFVCCCWRDLGQRSFYIWIWCKTRTLRMMM